MDWEALLLSLRLSCLTVSFLLPIGILIGWFLAYKNFKGKALFEGLFTIPLILPPTVIGYYLLINFGGNSFLGAFLQKTFHISLVFTFEGLLFASIIINLPYVILPIKNAFKAIHPEIRQAAAVSGMSPWVILKKIEIPLAWPGIVTGLVISFAHTLGEFGVVLMVGGAMAGRTKTISIAIYDRIQAFDTKAAGLMAALLLIISLSSIGLTFFLSRKLDKLHG
ncbi:MAG: molybdate ABC transporter permease subunit [Alphaproteobacteria bacterium]